MSGEPETANFAKYRTANPVVRAMIGHFYGRLRAVVEQLGAGSALDAGCGEGEAIERLRDVLPERVAGVDLAAESVRYAAARLPFAEISRQSVYELDFGDGEFDLVLCLEVLEHLERPDVALRELVRVARRDVVVSVPYEPYFRIGSLLRGKHLASLGNHPEHLNHWNRRTLRPFVRAGGARAEIRVAFPWLIAHRAV
jgi:SAM-dependent methyltransferase